jgi:2-polyprenyl-6-methoxyphenol hydroxylase-like FAD-dependent oxidoreductase
MSAENQFDCCIAGGGPAGMMLAYLLARAGVNVGVFEKHGDFLRDFRGDTVHPSTLEVIYELGLLEKFLQRPHNKVEHLSVVIGGQTIEGADFTHLPTHCKFVALMPQWDFLNFLVEQARQFPGFHLEMNSEATGVIEEDGRIVGARFKTQLGEKEVRARLTIGADGRKSDIRKSAKLVVKEFGSPIDVLWMRIPRTESDPAQTGGYADYGTILVLLQRGDYWQGAFVIPKDGFDAIRAAGLDAFRERIAQLAPFLRDRVAELRDWDQIKQLTVVVDRLEKWWRPGLLCIGDAAHAMSPIGGVGINLAIQDAVAAANILAPRFLAGNLSEHDLEAVQRRREFPTRATQKAQVTLQNHVVARVIKDARHIELPWQFRLLNRSKSLRRIAARLVAVGVRPEHVHTPAANRPQARAASA